MWKAPARRIYSTANAWAQTLKIPCCSPIVPSSKAWPKPQKKPSAAHFVIRNILEYFYSKGKEENATDVIHSSARSARGAYRAKSKSTTVYSVNWMRISIQHQYQTILKTLSTLPSTFKRLMGLLEGVNIWRGHRT